MQRVTPAFVDVVLMDLRMPAPDGLEVTRRLKSRYPEMKVLAMSATGNESLLLAVQAGVDGFIMKTASAPALIGAVRTVFRGMPYIDPVLRPLLFSPLTSVDHIAEQAPSLPPRLGQALALAARGADVHQIAQGLDITEGEAHAEIALLIDMLDATSLASAVAKGYEAGLIEAHGA